MMKDMYDKGDDNMKKIIGEAMLKVLLPPLASSAATRPACAPRTHLPAGGRAAVGQAGGWAPAGSD